jgi:hypothetical protein
VRLEGLGQLKNPVTSSRIEPATYKIVALVPQPTTLPRAPGYRTSKVIISKEYLQWNQMIVFLQNFCGTENNLF